MSKTPIIFDDDDEEEVLIDVDAAPIVDAELTAMGSLTMKSARGTSWIGRLLIIALSSFLLLMVSLQFWDFVDGLLARNLFLGRIAAGLLGLIAVLVIFYVIREIYNIMRLSRVDHLRQEIQEARISGARNAALSSAKDVANFYRNNKLVPEEAWRAHIDDILDADAILDYTEAKLLGPLDLEAKREIEKRARQVAMVTAFVPLALADLLTVLSSNIGMIRRIAEIYGGRPGFWGAWRLFRKVATHLVATGAVAVGDDVIGSVLGGNLLVKISQRFGEGVINAALTTRVGIATIEVCRPMPFVANDAPTTSELTSGALTNFLSTSWQAPN